MARARVSEEFLYDSHDLEQIFRSCVYELESETGFSSSVTEKVMHPAYQRIIGLGRQALPLLFSEIRHNPDHWFWALRAISGEDPTTPEDDFDRAIGAWLQWGKEHGYTG